MNLSAPFIARPVATTLTAGVALAGSVAFFLLPVSPLPQVDFPTIQVVAQMPGRESRDHGDQRRDAARTPSRRHRRCQRDDVVEQRRRRAHHHAVRARPRHRRRRARRSSGDQRRARRSADRAALEPDLQEGQPGGRADPDARADLRHTDAGTDLRSGGDRAGAETVAGRRHRQCLARRQFIAGGARRSQSERAVQIPDRARRRARGAGRDQRQQPQGRDRSRAEPVSDLHQRPGAHGRSLPSVGHRLSQRLGRAASGPRRGHQIRSRTFATKVSPTASPLCW